jgi:uridine kinase
VIAHELAHELAPALGATRPAILCLDSYYRDLAAIELAGRGRRNFDEPEALDSALIAEHVARLARGEAIAVPVYEFAHHARAPHTSAVVPGRVVIIEGLLTFYWEPVRTRLDARIFVTAADDECLARRLERDERERGRSPESIRRQWAETVRPMSQRHVDPQRAYATLVVNGTDPVAVSVAAIRAHVEAALRGRFGLPPGPI